MGEVVVAVAVAVAGAVAGGMGDGGNGRGCGVGRMAAWPRPVGLRRLCGQMAGWWGVKVEDTG